MAAFFNATRSPKAAMHVGRRLLRHGRDLLLHRRGQQLVNGNALVARLLRSALDLGVTVLTGKAATRLLGSGRVGGAQFADGQVIHARRGVVLACGASRMIVSVLRNWCRMRRKVTSIILPRPGKTPGTACAWANRPVAGA